MSSVAFLQDLGQNKATFKVQIGMKMVFIARCFVQILTFFLFWSDGERRRIRDENREKDRHHRRCRHRPRSGLSEFLS